MRKFRKSLDNGAPPNGGDADDPPSSAVNSPRAPRKSKGPSLPEGLNDGGGGGGMDGLQGGVPPASPATNRRRRSRNPNEETDGTLMDFLQQSNKDRLSVGEWSNSI